MTRSKGRSLSDRGNNRGAKPVPEPLTSRTGFVLTVGSWTLLFHPLFTDQLKSLTAAAKAEMAKRSVSDPQGSNTKLLFALWRLLHEEIPEDPSRPKYRQGGTLGPEQKHWMRAKFGNGRFRLFFRYRQDVRLIVLVWVNDAETLRTYGSRTDAYAVFKRMLESGNPPDDWDALVSAASAPEALQRARSLLPEQREARGSMRGMNTDLNREDF